MQINPYLHFNGNCEEALQFYERVLGGKILSLFRYGGSPMADQVGPEWSEKVMHARIQIGDALVMGSDTMPDRYRKPAGFAMSVNATEVAEADKVFAELAEGGTVVMPIQETFWAPRFGMLTDKFGVDWMVNVETPMPQ